MTPARSVLLGRVLKAKMRALPVKVRLLDMASTTPGARTYPPMSAGPADRSVVHVRSIILLLHSALGRHLGAARAPRHINAPLLARSTVAGFSSRGRSSVAARGALRRLWGADRAHLGHRSERMWEGRAAAGAAGSPLTPWGAP